MKQVLNEYLRIEVNIGKLCLKNYRGQRMELRDQEKLLHKRNLRRGVTVERRRAFKGGIEDREKHL